MKISNKSLHYRFNKLVQQDKFTYRAECNCYTTCSYIRTTIFSVFKGAFNIAVWFLLLMVVCWVVGSTIAVPIAIFFFGSAPVDIFLVPCAAVWFALTVVLAIFLFKQLKERMKRSFKPSKEPNIFIQAIVDKHNKFCTRVEVVA